MPHRLTAAIAPRVMCAMTCVRPPKPWGNAALAEGYSPRRSEDGVFTIESVLRSRSPPCSRRRASYARMAGRWLVSQCCFPRHGTPKRAICARGLARAGGRSAEANGYRLSLSTSSTNKATRVRKRNCAQNHYWSFDHRSYRGPECGGVESLRRRRRPQHFANTSGRCASSWHPPGSGRGRCRRVEGRRRRRSHARARHAPARSRRQHA